MIPESTLRDLALTFALAQRDFSARYRSASFGLAWIILLPAGMLAMYAFVFGSIFGARWPGVETGSNVNFAIVLFAGLTLHGFIADVLARASQLIANSATLLRQPRIAPEMLPLASAVSASVQFVVTLAVFYAAHAFLYDFSIVSVVLSIASAIPLLFYGVAFSYIVSAVCVYFKDIVFLVQPATMALLFICPIFYDLAAVPASLREYVYFNPLTVSVLNFRHFMFGGDSAGLYVTLAHAATGVVALAISVAVFKRLKRGFDVRI